MADRLEFAIRHRRGFESGRITRAERASADFVVNGQSLVELLDRAQNFSSDLIGCFAVGFDDGNARAAARLLLEDAPDSPSGRVLLYVCAECGDIGCGAYAVRISKNDGGWVWSDYAWENGYEDPQLLSLPSFTFADDTYRAVILAGSSLPALSPEP